MRCTLMCCAGVWRRLHAVSSLSHAHSCVFSPPQSTSTPPLQSQRRHRSFSFYLNLTDPEETRRHVEEDLARIDQEHQRGTMAHLHALLNLALAHYQAKDYVAAREYAIYAHDKTLQHNKNATLLYFTATTCAKCSAAAADAYEAHVREAEAAATVSSTLAPPPSALLAAERTIAKLREDAKRFEGIAQRMLNRPDKVFMRNRASTWTEDSRRDDEEPQEPFGEQWKERRKRPEHAAIRQYYKTYGARSTVVPK
uniref:Uncharacterized protein n=1 Tax=Trypanosoma congolense (strain IL3000) TaxID=1068625 RepID=G0UYW0_TRYCI|nr:conserved hypothetical protein [Trypanosoma congolense IL3000]